MCGSVAYLRAAFPCHIVGIMPGFCIFNDVWLVIKVCEHLWILKGFFCMNPNHWTIPTPSPSVSLADTLCWSRKEVQQSWWDSVQQEEVLVGAWVGLTAVVQGNPSVKLWLLHICSHHQVHCFKHFVFFRDTSVSVYCGACSEDVVSMVFETLAPDGSPFSTHCVNQT